MMKFLVTTLFLVLATFQVTSSYKILVYNPLFGHSHTNFLGKIADALTEAGHNVTVLLPIADHQLINKTGVKLTKNLRFVAQSEAAKELMEAHHEHAMGKLWTISPSPISMMQMMNNMTKMFSATCEQVITDTELINEYKREQFDIAIGEPFQVCSMAFFKLIGVKQHINAISTTTFDIVSKYIGEPVALSYVPSSMATFSDEMSFFERLLNTVQWAAMMLFFEPSMKGEMNTIWSHYPQMEHYGEWFSESSFILSNSNPYLDFPHPTIAKTIPIGGITVDQSIGFGKLPAEWDAILNKREKNVFVSFGSVAKSKDMPEEYKQALLNVFASMPDTTFIWKYEIAGATLAGHLPNVHLTTWAPQNELLADKRLSLFVTHGGLGSSTELAHIGKAAVMIPLFGDQTRNANMLSRHGGVVVLKKTDLNNVEVVKNAIETALTDKSYSKNAALLAEMLRNQPVTPKELLIRHVEFAAKFGQLPNLNPYGRHLNFFQYYLIDIAAFVIVVALVALFVCYKTFVFVARKCCGAKKVKSD